MVGGSDAGDDDPRGGSAERQIWAGREASAHSDPSADAFASDTRSDRCIATPPQRVRRVAWTPARVSKNTLAKRLLKLKPVFKRR